MIIPGVIGSTVAWTVEPPLVIAFASGSPPRDSIRGRRWHATSTGEGDSRHCSGFDDRQLANGSLYVVLGEKGAPTIKSRSALFYEMQEAVGTRELPSLTVAAVAGGLPPRDRRTGQIRYPRARQKST